MVVLLNLKFPLGYDFGEALGWGKPQKVENDAATRASEIVFSDTNGCQGGQFFLYQGPESMRLVAVEILLEALRSLWPSHEGVCNGCTVDSHSDSNGRRLLGWLEACY